MRDGRHDGGGVSVRPGTRSAGTVCNRGIRTAAAMSSRAGSSTRTLQRPRGSPMSVRNGHGAGLDLAANRSPALRQCEPIGGGGGDPLRAQPGSDTCHSPSSSSSSTVRGWAPRAGELVAALGAGAVAADADVADAELRAGEHRREHVEDLRALRGARRSAAAGRCSPAAARARRRSAGRRTSSSRPRRRRRRTPRPPPGRAPPRSTGSSNGPDVLDRQHRDRDPERPAGAAAIRRRTTSLMRATLTGLAEVGRPRLQSRLPPDAANRPQGRRRARRRATRWRASPRRSRRASTRSSSTSCARAPTSPTAEDWRRRRRRAGRGRRARCSSPTTGPTPAGASR